MQFKFLKQNVGAKIALLTIAAFLFVTFAFLALFFVLNINVLTKLTFIQVIMVFVLSQIFVGVTTILLGTNTFIKRPLEKLTDVMEMAESGNSLARINMKTGDEMEELAQNFNHMLAKLTELDARKIETERELIAAREGLKYKEALESKARVIKVTNLKLENSLKNLSILYVVSQTLSQSLDVGELYPAISRVMMDTLKLKYFSLLVKNQEGLLDQIISAGEEIIKNKTSFKMGEGIVGKVALELKTIHVGNMSLESRPLYCVGESVHGGSYLVLPLSIGERLIGVLTVGRLDIDSFLDAEIRVLESVASQIALAFDRSHLYMQTKQLAVKDELTGIYNRRYFQEVLRMEFKRAERFDRPLSLLMVDVDYFKAYNDRHGHVRGDMALKRLAKILSDNVREVDTVARFGGEEFVILLVDTDLEDAKTVAHKLRHLVEEDFMKLWEGKHNSQPITVSVGISAYPVLTRTEESLINSADLALYRAKFVGRNKVVVFDKSMLLADGEGEQITSLSAKDQ